LLGFNCIILVSVVIHVLQQLLNQKANHPDKANDPEPAKQCAK